MDAQCLLVLERLEQRLDAIEHRLDARLDAIQRSNEAMVEHIGFVESVWARVQTPFMSLFGFIGRALPPLSLPPPPPPPEMFTEMHSTS